MKKTLFAKILLFPFLLIFNQLKAQNSTNENISGLYLVSESKSIKIKPKNSITLVTQSQLNDSTWKVTEQSGKIIFIKDSIIVLNKRNSSETLYINETTQNNSIKFYNVTTNEIFNLKDVVGIIYNSKNETWQFLGYLFLSIGGIGLGVATPVAGLTKTDANKQVFNGVLLGSVSSLTIGATLAAIYGKEYYYSLSDSIPHKYNCQCSEAQRKKRFKSGFRLIHKD